jgi:phage terminase large subunit-like protein
MFERLEDQLCGWSPQSNDKSPDRMDALVWAVTELLIDPQELMMRTVSSGEYQISPI